MTTYSSHSFNWIREARRGLRGIARDNWISLRTKGLLAFFLLIGYAVTIGMIVLHHRNQAAEQMHEIKNIRRQEAALAGAHTLLIDTAMLAERTGYATSGPSISRELERMRALAWKSSPELAAGFPSLENRETVDRLFTQAINDPSRDKVVELVSALGRLAAALEKYGEALRIRAGFLANEYELTNHSAMVTALALGSLGLGLFGAALSLFFSRLIADLHSVQRRSAEIVGGYRGAPLALARRDEVGQLMEAVNRMAVDLDEREKQLAIERRKYFHQEKMAAIGSLAAGVAHEIGNPLAAISGVAQAIHEARASGACPNPGEDCSPEIILAQATRLAGIVREISDFASPRAAEWDLVDLNGLIRATVSLMRYDERFNKVGLALNLDHQLPAVPCVGDQVTQVIMNLLINAADALEGVMEHDRRITVSTRFEDGYARIEIEDNGCGMEEDTLRRVAEPFFTTKPAGKGTGLGLALCRSIAENHQGRLEISSLPGQGTRVHFLLPRTAKSDIEVESAC